MKIIVTKIKAGELLSGDLFSTDGQLYWDSISNNHSVGERVYIRTDEPGPKDQEKDEIYRLIIEK